MRILVNGTEVSQAWIDEMTRKLQNHKDLRDGIAPSPEELRKRAEECLIDEELISQYLMSPESPYPTPTEKRIQIELRQHPDYYATFQPEEARTKAILFIKRGLLEKEMKAKVPKLTEDEYKKIYDEHPDSFFLDTGYFVSRVDYYLEHEDSPSAPDAMVKLIQLKSRVENSQDPDRDWYLAMINESDSYQPDKKDNFRLLLKKALPKEIAEQFDQTEAGKICVPLFIDLNTVSLFRIEEKLERTKLLFEESRGLILKMWHQTQKDLFYAELGRKLREKAKIEYLDD